MRIEKRHPGHAGAFIKSGIAPKMFPSLKLIFMKVDPSKLINDANR